MTIGSVEYKATSERDFETVHPSISSFSGIAKRLIDLTVALVGGLALLPFFLLLVALIRLDSRGSALYKQRRIGLNGEEFMMYKFRSMHVGAETLQAELQALNEMDGPLFKMKNDPRITRVGRWLRRLSFDEFPQLINVIRGEMSLVGPRPPLPGEVEEFESWHRVKFQTRPGMTGLWQVSGRSELSSFRHMIQLDIEYVRNWSLNLDFQIFVKTFKVVFGGFGAH